MKQDYSQNCQLFFASVDGQAIGKMAKLELLCIELEKLIREDGELWPPHQQLTEIKDSAYEFLGAADGFFNYDPTPQFLYDDTAGEAPITLRELWTVEFNKKQELTR